MKLTQLYEKLSNTDNLSDTSSVPDGTYVAATLDADSTNRLIQFRNKLKVSNGLSSDKFHCTIIYSRKYNPDVKINNDLYPITAYGNKLEIFPTQDDKNALVLRLDCPDLENRHKDLMEEYDLTYDYDEYKSHITISYDCGDFSPDDYSGEFPMLVFEKEYLEDLILDWQNKK